MKASRSLLCSLLVFLLLAANSKVESSNRGGQFSKTAWLEDYQALKKFMEAGYANLDFARSAKKIDLAALDKQTTQALEKATSDDEAKDNLKKFLQAFNDGHLRLGEVDKPDSKQTEAAPVFKPTDSASAVCKELDYRNRASLFSLPFANLAGYQKVNAADDLFPTALLPLDNGKKFGLLRIGFFGPDSYLKNCEAAWEEYRPTLKADCNNDCQDKFYDFAVNRLSAQLTAQVKALQAKQIAGLIVDIAGNGGGTEWADIAARILAAKSLKAQKQSGVRHSRDIARFERHLQAVEADLKQTNLSAEQKKYLNLAKARVITALSEAKTPKPCDRSDIWATPDGGKKCSSLKTAESFSSGILEHAPAELLANLKSKEVLFNPSLGNNIFGSVAG